MLGVVTLHCRDQGHGHCSICSAWYLCGLCKLRNVTCDSTVLECLIIHLQNRHTERPQLQFLIFFLPLPWAEIVQDLSDDAGEDHGIVGDSGE